MRVSKVFCLSIFILLFSFSAFGQDYLTFYVDGQNGSDNNNGLSRAEAFQTIDRGVRELKTLQDQIGVELPRKLLILAGDYTNYGTYNNENLINMTNLWGTASHPVIIEGEGSVNVYGYRREYADINLGEENGLNRWKVDTVYTIISGINPRYVTVKNIRAVGAHEVVSIEGKAAEPNYPAYPLTGEDGTFHMTFENCSFENTTHYLGFFKGYGFHDFYFYFNRWIGNSNPAYGGHTHNIYWNPGTYGGPNGYNVAFIGNVFRFARRWGIQFNAALTHHIYIANNIFDHNKMGAVQFMQSNHVLVENNLVYNSGKQGFVFWMERNNYWAQKSRGRTPEPIHNIIFRNNTIDGPANYHLDSYWFHNCPSSSACSSINDQSSCQAAGCHWYEPQYSGCSQDTQCWADLPRWYQDYRETPSEHPCIHFSIQSSLFSDPNAVPEEYDNFHDITIENNICSNYSRRSITWEKSNPLCNNCNNQIRNNLFYNHDPSREVVMELYRDQESVAMYSLSEAQNRFPDLFENNIEADPLYSSVQNTQTVRGLWPQNPSDPYNTSHAGTSVWLHNYNSVIPDYILDPNNNFYLSENSPAIDLSSQSYPAIDIQGSPRPLGHHADIGAYEYVYDACPGDENKTGPGVCGCGTPDTDTDGDGTPNCIDLCPDDAAKIEPGSCGCGSSDRDGDGDGTPDCLDQCPNDNLKIEHGICGCGVSDVDLDNDGVSDCLDECPGDPLKSTQGVCGCGVADEDLNQNDIIDCLEDSGGPGETPGDPGKDPDKDPGDDNSDNEDLCPADPNKIEAGICGCGTADLDQNGNGIIDCLISEELEAFSVELMSLIKKLPKPGLFRKKTKAEKRAIRKELKEFSKLATRYSFETRLSGKSLEKALRKLRKKTKRILRAKDAAQFRRAKRVVKRYLRKLVI